MNAEETRKKISDVDDGIATLKADLATLRKVEGIPTAGNNPRGRAPEALTSLIEQTPAYAVDPLMASIVSYVVAEAFAETKGSKFEIRVASLERSRDEIITRAAVLRVFAAQVAYESSPEALRDKAQSNVTQEKVAKVQRENSEIEAQNEDLEARISKVEGKPAPAGSSMLDAIKKAHKTPQRITPANW